MKSKVVNDRWKEYFEFSSCSKRRTNGLCTLCKGNYKDKEGIFSNFLKHLERLHPREYHRVFKPDEEDMSSHSTAPMNDSLADIPVSIKCKQQQLNASITKNLVIRCNLPLSVVENPAFLEFMKELNPKWQPISSKALKLHIIPSFVNNTQTLIRQALIGVKEVTLTIDAWSDKRCRSFLGVTVHFIDDKLTPRAYLIDFLRFKPRHTGQNILQTTEDVLERFGLKEKVFRIVTDNASAMIKAYQFGLSADEEDFDSDHQMQVTASENMMCNDDDGE
jgi:hypothetical protein